MSTKEVLLLMEQSGKNTNLQTEIKKILGSGDGNISDAYELDSEEIIALKGEKAQAIAELAQQKGLNFSVTELVKVIEAFEKNKQETELFNSLGLSDIDNSDAPQGEIVEMTYRGQVYRKVMTERPATAAQINPKREVVQFLHKSSEDGEWQTQIKQILGIGDGNISNAAELDEAEATALQGSPGAKITEFAHRHGFYFSQPDLIEVVQMFQAQRQGRLSEAELFSSLGVSTDALSLLATQKLVKLIFKRNIYEKMMSESNPKLAVIQFIEKTGESESLQLELERILGVGDGNISSATKLDENEAEALKGPRGAAVTDFALSQGFSFAQQDLINVVEVFERHRQGEISQVDLFKILELPTTEGISGPTQNIQEYIYRGQRYKKIDGVIIPIDELEVSSTHSNPKTQVIGFMEKTATDTELQKELQQLLGVGDGDISSVAALEIEEAEALRSGKSNFVKDLAHQKGFQFSDQDLIEVISAFQRHQRGDISQEQLFESLGISRTKKGFFDKVVDLLNRNIWTF